MNFETLAILYKHFVLGAVSIADGLYLMATVRCNVGANWFLPAMFLAAMIYYLYILYPNKAVWSIISVLLLAVLPHLPEGHVWVLLFRGALGFVFMFTGSLLKEYLTKKIYGTSRVYARCRGYLPKPELCHFFTFRSIPDRMKNAGM